MKTFDYLVIGSGCSGAMAAQTLVEAGLQVTMLDVGEQNTTYKRALPDADFTTIRKTDPDQHRYFIGDNQESLSWGKVGKGEQITPPRKHITQSTDKYLPLTSDNFSPLESLGYGGLGIGWGLQCWEYSESDLRATGLNESAMRNAYEIVGSRIGISATHDDAHAYTLGKLTTYQPSPVMDGNHRLIHSKYLQRKASFNRQGLYVGRTPLALLTQDTNGRKKYAYKEMDFYSDRDQSAWRPWITVNALKKKPNFHYINGHLLTKFTEKDGYVEVHCLTVPANETVRFRCKKLILATGALGSARIVLRSLGNTDVRLPLLCNPYSYVPCLQPRLVGRAMESKKLGFAQLSLFLDESHANANISVASLYDYHSLMLFRIIRQVPLNFSDSRVIMQYLMSGLEIMGIHHPDKMTSAKHLSLAKDSKSPTGDRLKATYQLSEAEKHEYTARNRKFIRAMRKMGTYALKTIDPGYGASIHYAGTLPISTQTQPYRLTPSGRIHGTRHVYVADSSGFTFLPAPGLTFSLMANAHIVASKVITNE